jgi:hypothetical protein
LQRTLAGDAGLELFPDPHDSPKKKRKEKGPPDRLAGRIQYSQTRNFHKRERLIFNQRGASTITT